MVDNFDSRISIDKVKPAKDHPEYIVKEYSDFGGFKNVVSPLKSLDMRGLSRKTMDSYSFETEIRIIEKPHYVCKSSSWDSIRKIIDGDNDFGSTISMKTTLHEELKNTMAFPSISFSRDPFVKCKKSFRDEENSNEEKTVYKIKEYEPLNEEDFKGFLDNLWAYSKGMLLVPDIIIGHNQTVQGEVPEKTKPCTVDNFIKRIDSFYNLLKAKNKKPIFVPIQADQSIKINEQIISHYKKNGYCNIWVDFTGGAISKRRLAGLRGILRKLDEVFGKNGYVVYYSHLKREYRSHMKESECPASDMLTQFVEADIVGLDRPRLSFVPDEDDDKERMIEFGAKTEEEWEAMKTLNRSRIFDPASYYYYFPSDHPSLNKKGDTTNYLDPVINKAIDSLLKVSEVETVKVIKNEKNLVRPYIKDKKMFKNEKEIYDKIFGEEATKSLFGFKNSQK